MMNIQSTNAADAAASPVSSAGKKGGDKADGFSNALSEFDKDPVGQKAENKSAGDEGEAAPQDDDAGESLASKPRPIIEIRPESLRRPTTAQLEQSQQVRHELPKEVDGSKTGRELTAAEKKLKEALTNAKALTEKADAMERAEGKEDAAADLDLAALLAGGDGDAELSHILTLLNGHGANAALEVMAPGQKGPAAPGKRGQGDDGVVPGKASARSAMDALSASTSITDATSLPGKSDATTEQDRLFRFQGAKGERQSMDMIVGEGRGERNVEFRNSSGGAAETVTVLDSRRFLGLAPNASALTSALSGDKQWAAAMQSSSAAQNIAAQNATGGVVNTLKLQMNPHDLGSVTAMLRLQGDALNVHLTVETRAAYRQLADDSNGILDALRSQGFAVDQVTISIASSSSSDATRDQQAGQNGQQASGQGEKQGSAADNGQEKGPGRQFSDQAAGNGNEVASDNQTVSASGNARPGQLYL
jgi:chemotaxis protein MotD